MGPRPSVLLATSEAVHPLFVGGIQASPHDLLVGLTTVAGCPCRLLSAVREDLAVPERRLRELGVPARVSGGRLVYVPGPYEVVVVPQARFDEELAVEIAARPDLVVAQAAGWRSVVRASRAASVPVVHWMHGWMGLEGGEPNPEADRLLANSDYTRRHVLEAFGLDSIVFPPPVDPARVRADRTAGPGGRVTMVNPHPLKGVERFLELAEAMPRAPFLAVDAWGTPPFVGRRLARLANVERRPSTLDMRPVYADTAVLLVPTSWDETFGRVVVEAHVNGIPVLASDRGALPDVVGAGGRALPYEAPLADWIAALTGLLDPDRHPDWSRAARANAGRFDFQAAIRRFLDLASE